MFEKILKKSHNIASLVIKIYFEFFNMRVSTEQCQFWLIFNVEMRLLWWFANTVNSMKYDYFWHKWREIFT